MYGYYGMSTTRFASVVRPVAKYITTMQMIQVQYDVETQFVVGNFGLGLAYYYFEFTGHHCSGDVTWGMVPPPHS